MYMDYVVVGGCRRAERPRGLGGGALAVGPRVARPQGTGPQLWDGAMQEHGTMTQGPGVPTAGFELARLGPFGHRAAGVRTLEPGA